MNVQDHYGLAPNVCRFCSQPRLPVVDTLYDEWGDTWQTRVYVCAHCVRNMAGLLKPRVDWVLLDQVAVDGLVGEVGRLEAEAVVKDEKIAALETLFAQFDRAVAAAAASPAARLALSGDDDSEDDDE